MQNTCKFTDLFDMYEEKELPNAIFHIVPAAKTKEFKKYDAIFDEGFRRQKWNRLMCLMLCWNNVSYGMYNLFMHIFFEIINIFTGM